MNALLRQDVPYENNNDHQTNDMKKIAVFLFFACIYTNSSHAQLALSKMLGKDADKYRLGYGLFTFFNFPLQNENQSIRLELMDLAYFRGKDGNGFTTGSARAYLSVKLGYKHVFSETKTGFYLEPAAGYCRVVYTTEGEDATHGDGLAMAMEGGYSLEVGQRGHVINLGIKYESDRGGKSHVINSVGLRLSYEFNMFRNKNE